MVRNLCCFTADKTGTGVVLWCEVMPFLVQ